MSARRAGVGAARDDPGLDRYFRQLGSFRLLTAEEEVALARRIETGRAAAGRLGSADGDGDALRAAAADGQAAFEHFVGANLRLVVKVAARAAQTSSLELADLIQEGCLGLIVAVERYDWRSGYRFSTYGTWLIRQAVQLAMAQHERPVRLPHRLHRDLVKVRAARNRLEGESASPPTDDAIAEATSLTVAAVRRAHTAGRPTLSLDGPSSDRVHAAASAGWLSDHQDVEMLVVERHERVWLLQIAEHALDERSWRMIVLRFGLDGEKPRSIAEVAEQLGVCTDTARSCLHHALDRLRRAVQIAA